MVLKKKKRRKIKLLLIIYILLGVYIVSEIYYYLHNKTKQIIYDKNSININTSVFDIDINNIKTFKIQNLEFVKKEGQWFVTQSLIPADNKKVHFFLTYLNGIKPIKIIDENPNVQYGFLEGKILYFDNKKYIIGYEAIEPNTIYIKHPSNKILVVSKDFLEFINNQLPFWFNKDLSTKFNNIDSILITSDNINHSLKKIDDIWFYFDIKGRKTKASLSTINNLITNLENLKATMIIFNDMIQEKTSEINLIIKDISKAYSLQFFKAKPSGYIDYACFVTRKDFNFSYQINCEDMGILLLSKTKFLALTDFTINLNNISKIEIKDQFRFLKIIKENDEKWIFNQDNKKDFVIQLSNIFRNLEPIKICTPIKNCINKNLNATINIVIYNKFGDASHIFKFYNNEDKYLLQDSLQNIIYVINKDNYIKLTNLINSF